MNPPTAFLKLEVNFFLIQRLSTTVETPFANNLGFISDRVIYDQITKPHSYRYWQNEILQKSFHRSIPRRHSGDTSSVSAAIQASSFMDFFPQRGSDQLSGGEALGKLLWIKSATDWRTPGP
jgi:hypothetical protein